jgi:hypothetical protein
LGVTIVLRESELTVTSGAAPRVRTKAQSGFVLDSNLWVPADGRRAGRRFTVRLAPVWAGVILEVSDNGVGLSMPALFDGAPGRSSSGETQTQLRTATGATP